MCVVCKARFTQNSLFRLRIKNFDISTDCDSGRSFYICQKCIKTDEKILKKIMSKFVKTSNLNLEKLKERLLYGGCSHTRNSN
ncbi:DUF448 domain-containing protein [Campylobacter geochelonis]|nr:DUF448 domain-containing protein [Campylobacter geochelonis]